MPPRTQVARGRQSPTRSGALQRRRRGARLTTASIRCEACRQPRCLVLRRDRRLCVPALRRVCPCSPSARRRRRPRRIAVADVRAPVRSTARYAARGKCLDMATPRFGDTGGPSGRGLGRPRPGCAPRGEPTARLQGMLALTTLDLALSVPAVVYATPLKYQTPAARLLIVVLVCVALATCTIWVRLPADVP
jgi:hypothetical protein